MNNHNQVSNSPKTNKTNLIIAVVIALMIGFALGDRSHYLLKQVARISGLNITTNELEYRYLDDAYKELRAKYDGEIDQNQLIHGAIKGLSASLGDRYTVYLDPKEAEEFHKSLSGDVGAGIGAEIGLRNEMITIIRPLKDNPAFKAGLMAGDVVYRVNDEDVSSQTLEQVVQKIRGKAGSTVKITIVRKDQPKPLDFKITRDVINNPSVELEYNDDLPVLKISRFDQDTARLARLKAEEIKRQGHKKIILDLRGNAGGYLTAAQDLAGLWLDGQLVVSEKKGDKVIQEFSSSSGKAILADFETIILTNAGSASASEIVIGALKGYDKAKTVGEKTFGKGSVQELIRLANGGELKITIARWYTPKGQNIDGVGFSPDKEVELTPEDWQNGRDPQLQAALDLLR